MADPWVPGTWDLQLFFPAGKLSGRGRGACPGPREPCLRAPSLPGRRPRLCRADGPSGALYSSRPQAPATCRKLPRRPLSLGCNPLCRGSSFCPVTLFLKHSCLVYFSVACGCGVFPQSPKRKPSISACVRASLSYSLDHWLVLSTLAVDRSFWQCLESPSSLTVPEVRIKSLCTLCLLVLLRLPSRYSCF